MCTEEDYPIFEYIKTSPQKKLLVDMNDALVNKTNMECLLYHHTYVNSDIRTSNPGPPVLLLPPNLTIPTIGRKCLCMLSTDYGSSRLHGRWKGLHRECIHYRHVQKR